MSTTLEKKYKECKFCGEEVLVQAVRCKHCQGNLGPSKTGKLVKKVKATRFSKIKTSIIAAISAVVLFGGIYAYSSISHYYSTDYHIDKIQYEWHDGEPFYYKHVKFSAPIGTYYESHSESYIYKFFHPNPSEHSFGISIRIDGKNIESFRQGVMRTSGYLGSTSTSQVTHGKNNYYFFKVRHKEGWIGYYQLFGHPFTIEMMLVADSEVGGMKVIEKILSSLEVVKL